MIRLVFVWFFAFCSFTLPNEWNNAVAVGMPIRSTCCGCNCNSHRKKGEMKRNTQILKHVAESAQARAEGQLEGKRKAETFEKPVPEAPPPPKPHQRKAVPSSGEAKVIEAHLAPKQAISGSPDTVEELETLVDRVETRLKEGGLLRGSAQEEKEEGEETR